MVSNINVSVGEFVGSDSDSEINSEHAIQMYAKICQLVLHRGAVSRGFISHVTSNSNKSVLDIFTTKRTEEDVDLDVIRRKIEKLGHLGHPIIIEFLLLPEIHSNSRTSKYQPAFLVEQWMIQLLPQRLVSECPKQLAALSNEIYGYCSSSMINNLLFGNCSPEHTIKIRNLRCAYRMTNLRGANVFSSCWFSINTDELSAEGIMANEDEHESSDYGALFRHSSPISIAPHYRAQTTMRTKLVNRTYLCNSNLPSHFHEHDTTGICSSHAFTRLSICRADVLDTTVTSILELPTEPPPSLNASYCTMKDGVAYLSLPVERTAKVPSSLLLSDNQKHVVLPKSPVVIMSNWNLHQTNYSLETSKQAFQTKGKLDDCIHEFNSLNVHQKLFQRQQQTSCNALEEILSITEHEMDGEVTLRPNKGRKVPSRTSNSCSNPSFSIRPSKSFHWRTGLPLQSSPVPAKRHNSTSFDFDESRISSTSNCPQVFPLNQTSDNSNDIRIVFDLDDEIERMAAVQDVKKAELKKHRPTTLALKRPCQKDEHQRGSWKRKTSENWGKPLSSSAPLFNISPVGCSLSPGCAIVAAMPGTPLPVMSQQLLINFEESMLNGRIPASGLVEGFQVEIGASGSFFPAHLKLPVSAYFFNLSDDNAPSPYLGFVDLSQLPNKRGYHVPKTGSIQLTLFNPSSSVVKVFVIQYNLTDMPANCQTFLRQRTVYMPVERGSASIIPDSDQSQQALLPVDSPPSLLFISESNTTTTARRTATSSNTFQPEFPIFDPDELSELPAFLRYLVHLRFHTTKSNHLYLHTDIRLIFARDKFEFDPRVATYQMRAFVDGPSNPRYSPKK